MGKSAKSQANAGASDKPSPRDEPQLSQRDKFIRAAREAGCDETGKALDEALRKIARAGKR